MSCLHLSGGNKSEIRRAEVIEAIKKQGNATFEDGSVYVASWLELGHCYDDISRMQQKTNTERKLTL